LSIVLTLFLSRSKCECTRTVVSARYSAPFTFAFDGCFWISKILQVNMPDSKSEHDLARHLNVKVWKNLFICPCDAWSMTGCHHVALTAGLVHESSRCDCYMPKCCCLHCIFETRFSSIHVFGDERNFMMLGQGSRMRVTRKCSSAIPEPALGLLLRSQEDT